MSDDTAGRYIKLSKSAALRTLLSKYRTLNSAYQGEGITSPQRQRITVKEIGTPPPMPSRTPETPPSVTRPNGEGNTAPRNESRNNGNGNGNGHSSGNGDGNGIDLKAKVRGGGNVGDFLNKLSPKARKQFEEQLEIPREQTVKTLAESLMQELNDCDSDKTATYVVCIKPIADWYEKYAAKADVAFAE